MSDLIAMVPSFLLLLIVVGWVSSYRPSTSELDKVINHPHQ